MDVYFPSDEKTKRSFPGIVFVHGGGWIAGKRISMRSSAEAAALHGFVGFNLAYDLVSPTIAREVGDIEAAIADIRARAASFHLDPNRLGALGGSAGAQLVMQAAVVDHAPLRAAVGWSGPYDLTVPFFGPNARAAQRTHLDHVVHRVLACGTDQRRCADAAAAMSPARRAGNGTPPVLLFNSAAELVAVGQMDALAAALRAHGDPVETRELLGRRHAEAYHATAIDQTLAFFARYL